MTAVEELEPLGWRRVRLITPEGMMVRDLVVPPFDTLPEVILYGARVFVKCTNPGMGVYREATNYAVPYEDVDAP